MTRVWHLHNDGVYHRQVQARRHAVIEEAGVHHRPVGAHRILFVQRPADSLDAPSLHLALDVARVNCLACILDGCEPKNGYLARVRVHLHISDVAGEGAAHATRIDGGAPDDRPSGRAQLPGQLLERELEIGLALAAKHAGSGFDGVRLDLPETRGPRGHLPVYILRGLDRRQARGKRRAAAARHRSVTDRVGIRDRGPDVFRRNPQHLGGLHGDGRAGSANIRGALHKIHRAVGVDTDAAAGLQADVEPEAHGDAAPAVRSVQGGAVVWMILHRFQHFRAADAPVLGPVGAAGPLPRGVLEAEVDGVHS